MEAIRPYLYFNGNAAEALDFYGKALGGETVFSQTFGESAMPVSEGDKGKIIHARFRAGDLELQVSDGTEDHPVTAGTNLHLSLNFNSLDELNRTFAALSQGGKVTMELQDTFWGARFGMLTDQFGFHWMFNHDYKK